MTVLAVPILQFAIHEDGSLAVLSPWYPQIVVAQHLLDVADGQRIAVRGDELTFRCTNGGAVYALDAPDLRVSQMDGSLLRTGHLLRSWS